LIYLDSSVVLAHLLAEAKAPPPKLWNESLVSSRLLTYETWDRVHRLGLTASHGPLVDRLLERVAFLELREEVLARAKEPFPAPVRTLDALHLASVAFLAERGVRAPIASYDDRLLAAARALKLPIAKL